MLCLTRKIGQSVFVGKVKITVSKVRGEYVMLSFDSFGENVEILREELKGKPKRAHLHDDTPVDESQGPR